MLDYKLTFINGKPVMSHELVDSTINNIFLSIHIRRGSFMIYKNLGSRLFTIKKITEDAVNLAHDYVVEALQWMIDSGRLTSLDVVTEEKRDENSILIKVTAKKNNGKDINFQTFYRMV